jgi:hypothetical protein
MALTLVSLDVWAVTAVKGDWSGSGTSMIVGRCIGERSRGPMEVADRNAECVVSGKQTQSVPWMCANQR